MSNTNRSLQEDIKITLTSDVLIKDQLSQIHSRKDYYNNQINRFANIS